MTVGKRRGFRLFAVLGVTAIAALGAACGDDDEDTASSAAAGASSVAADVQSQASEAATDARVAGRERAVRGHARPSTARRPRPRASPPRRRTPRPRRPRPRRRRPRRPTPRRPSPSVAEGVVDFEEAVPGSGEGLKIGYISLGDSVPFVKLVSDSIKREAEAAGAELDLLRLAARRPEGPRLRAHLQDPGRAGLPELPGRRRRSPARSARPARTCPVIAIDIHQEPCEIVLHGRRQRVRRRHRRRGDRQVLQGRRSNCEYDAFVSLESARCGRASTGCAWAARARASRSICGPIPATSSLRRRPHRSTARTKFADTLTALPGQAARSSSCVDQRRQAARRLRRGEGRQPRRRHLARRPGCRPDLALRDPEQPELDRRRRLLPGALRRDRRARA